MVFVKCKHSVVINSIDVNSTFYIPLNLRLRNFMETIRAQWKQQHISLRYINKYFRVHAVIGRYCLDWYINNHKKKEETRQNTLLR